MKKGFLISDKKMIIRNFIKIDGITNGWIIENKGTTLFNENAIMFLT